MTRRPLEWILHPEAVIPGYTCTERWMMATTETGTTQRKAPLAEVLEGLNDLLQLDHDAIGSYEIAIEKLEDRELALQIEGFRRDHERHIRDLNELIVGLGGTPANEPHATAPLKQAMQQIAARGGDDAILIAWRTNEFQALTKYDSYAHRALWWPAEAKRVVDRNALDEERHYRWVVETLGGEDPAEVGLANRAREELARARTVARRVRRRVEGLAGRARELRARAGAGPAGDGGVREVVEERIREKPAAAMAGVFAAGFIIGRILR